MSKQLGLIEALLLVSVFLVPAILSARPRHLELVCQPVYAIRDDRLVEYTIRDGRPVVLGDARGQRFPGRSYFLFDNAELFDYQVSLTNLEAKDVRLPAEIQDWPASLTIVVSRDGEELPMSEFTVVPAQRSLRQIKFFRDGAEVRDMKFERVQSRRAPRKLDDYDARQVQEKDVDVYPSILDTFDRVSQTFRIVDENGGPLPLGVYRVRISDSASGTSCSEQEVQMRAPESTLDVVDAHIVRANFHRAQGDLNAVAQEYRLATEREPDSLKAWWYRGSVARELDDREEVALVAAAAAEILSRLDEEDIREAGRWARELRGVAARAPELAEEAARSRD